MVSFILKNVIGMISNSLHNSHEGIFAKRILGTPAGIPAKPKFLEIILDLTGIK